MSTETKNRAGLADMAMHLSNQLASDMETLREIKARWDANGRCQAEDLIERQRAYPVPDPGHELHGVLAGIGTYQDSLDTELYQAIEAGGRLLEKLRRVDKLVNR